LRGDSRRGEIGVRGTINIYLHTIYYQSHISILLTKINIFYSYFSYFKYV
jgi:hypothetical protein